MHFGIWELQGNKNGKLIKTLEMKKLTIFEVLFLVKNIQKNLVKIIVIFHLALNVLQL